MNKRLLLIDDEPAVLLPMARYFVRAGFDVVSAREKEQAQALVKEEAFDLVILDLRLGGGGPDGLEILREIQARRTRPAVIILSGLVSAELRADVARQGAGAVLQKPQSLRDIERVADILMTGAMETARPTA